MKPTDKMRPRSVAISRTKIKKSDFSGVTPSPQRSHQRLDKAQRKFLYDELNLHLEKRLETKEFTLRRINLASSETENSQG